MKHTERACATLLILLVPHADYTILHFPHTFILKMYIFSLRALHRRPPHLCLVLDFTGEALDLKLESRYRRVSLRYQSDQRLNALAVTPEVSNAA